MKLYKRHIFSQIKPYVGDDTIIVLHGARQVGKTHILLYLQHWLTQSDRRVFFFDLEYPDVLADLNKGPDALIAILTSRGLKQQEEAYVLIDEIQYLDAPSSFLKIIADHHKRIHLIVSGSSTFAIKNKFTDSLAGRTTVFEVYPLSFAEFLEFKETGLVMTPTPAPSVVARLKELYREFTVYGGYPKIVLTEDIEKKKRHMTQFIDDYIRKDVRDLAQVEDIRKFNNLLMVLAAQSGQLIDLASLSRETTLSYPTIVKYLTVLEETYVIKRVPPWSNSPSVEISKMPKVFFFDTGIQTILWLHAFQTTIVGSVFETSVFSELVKRYGREAIRYWRTKAGAEVDFVVANAPRNLRAIEVKRAFSSFNPRSLRAFMKRYPSTDGIVVGLDGEKPASSARYPWEL